MGESFPGGGAVEINVNLLRQVIHQALSGMNAIYDLHALSEHDLEIQSMGFIEVIEQMV